jgi:hypothetical protein
VDRGAHEREEVMGWSTLEQLKAWWTPARKADRLREDQRLIEAYPGQYIAYTDDWNGEELTRTVVAVSPDPAEFQRLLSALEPEVRRRVQLADTHPVDTLSIGSAFFE